MTPQVVLLPPRAAQLDVLKVATGIRSVWRCALFAAGARVVMPPFGFRTSEVMHGARDPSAATMDVFVPLQLCRSVASPWDAWELRTGTVYCGATPRRAFGTARRGNIEQVTSATLLDLAENIGLEVPDNLRWAELFRDQTHGVLAGLQTLGTSATRSIAA